MTLTPAERENLCGKEKCQSYVNVLSELNQIKKLTQKLDTVLDSSYDGIYITDGKGITLRVNRSYERITGLQSGEFLGKNVEYLVEKGLISKACSTIVLEKKEVVTIEQKLSTGKTLLVTSTPIFDDNHMIEMVVTNVRDITELIRLKEAIEEKDRQVDQYNMELQMLKSQLHQKNQAQIETRNKDMKTLLETITRVASHDTTVLVTGETGVGKEVIVEYIHQHSLRAQEKLIKVNCGAIPETLIESELFGYEKGSFTGANSDGKIGLFEEANGGTLFLDEIAELPFNVQAKLLRVLQEQEIHRIGGVESIPINVRILAATNKNLEKLAQKGEFRTDLYYRLNIIPICIPPLRERREDIIPLATTFLNQLSQKYAMPKTMTKEVYDFLYAYQWPGNIRELKNLIERMYVMCQDARIYSSDLPEHIKISKHASALTSDKSLKEQVADLEKKLLDESYAEFGNVRDAARHLGIDASTFVRKRQKYAGFSSNESSLNSI